MIGQATFRYYPLDQALEKQTKRIEDQGKKQIKAIEDHGKQLAKDFTEIDRNSIPLEMQMKKDVVRTYLV